MAYREKLREGTLADAIDKFVVQSQQFQWSESEVGGGDVWDHAAMAPGHTLRDFLHEPPLTPPGMAPPSSPPPLRDTGEVYGPQNREVYGPQNREVYGPQNRPQPPTDRDREDPTSVPGVCGLLNMGNTCYMNAGLQCIRGIPEIAQYYLGSPKFTCGAELPPNSHQGHLSCRLSTLLHKLWSGQFSALHPKAFKATLGVLHPQFSDNRQQDCQEFLAMLLDTLHEDSAPSHEDPAPSQPPDQPMEQTSNQITENESRDSPESTNQIADIAPQSGTEGTRRSVVSETFQGMLKNEVECQTCRHLSTKEEPFVYLSVPLPHAYERQIYVQWMPVAQQPGSRRAVRLLVTVLKDATVGVFKDALAGLIGQPLSHDLVQLAEVKDNCIVRILADSVAVKKLDDEANDVFAFELSPLPGSTAQGTGESEREEEGERRAGAAVSGRKHGKESDSEMEALPTKIFKGEEQASSRDGDASPAPVITTANDPGVSATNSSNSPAVGDPPIDPVISQPNETPRAVVMEWHSCAICLEEMVDSELVTHAACGAVLCPSCLQASVEHYSKEEKDLVPCPICSVMVKPSTQFTPLAEPVASQSLIKLLQTTILFRTVSKGYAQLLAPPAVLHLPESASGLDYYHAISPLLPATLLPPDHWTLSLTDAKGRCCSRCLYGSGCRGCIITHSSSTPHNLRPGDYLAVTIQDGVMVGGGASELGLCEWVSTHPSLATRRDNKLSLQECLSVFSQREKLEKDNRWFCPSCKAFCSASQVLSVSTLPLTVIIHLKRFIYHGTTSSKVDAAVNFPLELDPRLVSHDCHMTHPLQLTACVCHFGSLNCGHYTAYVRHMLTGEWAYYNDETVTMVEPSEKDAECAYILFYRRKELPPPSLPTLTKSFDDEAEMKSVAQLLRQHKPLPLTSSKAPPPLPRRSNSTGDLRPPTTEAITAQTNDLLASLGLDPSSATITCALPSATSITQSTGSHSPHPIPPPSSLLTPPPSNPSSITQTTSILEDYMNYDLSDESLAAATSRHQLLGVRAKEW